MTESDMFPPDDSCDPKCDVCGSRFHTGTSFSLHFCREECIRLAVKNNHRSIDRADRYFVKLLDAEARIKEMEAVWDELPQEVRAKAQIAAHPVSKIMAQNPMY